MCSDIIPEQDILIATTAFLIKREVIPYQFLVAAGRGIDPQQTIKKLTEAYKSIGHEPPNFSGTGADILAISDKEWWAVECKGSGGGKPQTQRNNFDRALASTVSYYEEKPPTSSPDFKNAKVFISLALPSTDAYLNELRKRVRKALRRRLNLWILLYDFENRVIQPISPEKDI